MVDLTLNTEVLEWAARQVGQTLDTVARVVTKSEPSFEKVLGGRLTPSQAQKFSKETRVPFGLLFLSEPPGSIRQVIPDLRQAPNPLPLSADFFEVLEDAIRKQEWFKEHLEHGGTRKLPFVGSFNVSSSPQEVATDIRQKLNLSDLHRSECKDQDEYFRLLSSRAEQAGILVLKSGIVKSNTRRSLSPREFRGFAISDDIAPLVFINGRDWEIAHVFTLLHEIGHIWLGQSGVSDFAYKRAKGDIEIFCNRVASEVLVPEAEFLLKFRENTNLTVLAKHFRVSRLVVARRALDLKRIEKTDYDSIASVSAASDPPAKDSDGGNPYATYPIRNSRRLTSALVSSALSGETLLRDAAALLNVRPQTIITLSQKMKLSG